MCKARIRILIFVGLALVASCVFIAAEFPNQLADFNREPEDVWGVALYGAVFAVAAFSYLGAAATILRSSLHWLARPVAISSGFLLIFGTVVLGVLAVVSPPPGSPNDPQNSAVFSRIGSRPVPDQWPIHIAASYGLLSKKRYPENARTY